MNKKEYEERIAKLEKELDELKEVEIEDDEFPKYGELYWFVDSDGYVVYAYWSDDTDDNYRKDFLRIFKTKKECKRYLEIQKAFKEKSKNFEPNWQDCVQDKYYLFTIMIEIILRLFWRGVIGQQLYILKVEKY